MQQIFSLIKHNRTKLSPTGYTITKHTTTKMEIGIDSFASAMYSSKSLNSIDAMEQLLDRITLADEAGLDVFGIGEHHKKEFLDSATVVILAAAAARTKRIRLASAVAVLSAADRCGFIRTSQRLISFRRAAPNWWWDAAHQLRPIPSSALAWTIMMHCSRKSLTCY